MNHLFSHRLSRHEKTGLAIWFFLFCVLSSFIAWYRTHELLQLTESPPVSDFYDSTPIPNHSKIRVFQNYSNIEAHPDHQTLKPALVNLNTADSIQLEKLPWIGPVLAGRIYRFRERLGGFFDIQQLKDIYGFREETWGHIKDRVMVDGILRPLLINTHSLEDMATHPYVGWTKARLLVNYRKQHGPYQNIESVIQSQAFDSIGLEKIKPYLKGAFP